MRIEHSQNFLHSKKLVSELLDKTNLNDDDTVIEIGPGKGIITEELSKKCKRIIAIEYDNKLSASLKETFSEDSKIQIIEQDFLKYKLPNSGEYKICANIPFNLTADIMKKVLEFENSEGLGKIYTYQDEMIHMSYFKNASEKIAINDKNGEGADERIIF